MSTAKVDRLLNLMATLLDAPRPVTASEIQRRVPGYPEAKASFQRAFERDKEALRDMGVPLRIEPVPRRDPPIDGYRIRKDEYHLRDPGLEPDERAALALAATSVRLDGIAGTGALWKLGGRETGAGTGDGTAPEAVADLPGDPNLAAMFAGVVDHRRVVFRYHQVERRFDPWRLVFHRGRWYVGGFDHTRDDERVYRLDRIDGAVHLDADAGPAPFARPSAARAAMQLEPWELGDRAPVRARVVIDRAAATSAVHARPGVGSVAVTERRDDGSVVIELDVTNPDGFRSFLLTFLEHAEVLGPPELRADVIDWLERVATTTADRSGDRR